MMRLITILALAAVAVGSCRPSDHSMVTDPQGTPQTSADYRLRVGETIVLRNPGIRVHADSLSDSRCPTSVVCAVAGSVVVAFTAQGDRSRESFTVSLTGVEAENEFNAPTVEVLGHSFRMRRVDPYPARPGRTPDSDYRLVLIAR